MRLIAQAKQGFYPAAPEAIAGILRHLKIPDPPTDSKFKRTKTPTFFAVCCMNAQGTPTTPLAGDKDTRPS